MTGLYSLTFTDVIILLSSRGTLSTLYMRWAARTAPSSLYQRTSTPQPNPNSLPI